MSEARSWSVDDESDRGGPRQANLHKYLPLIEFGFGRLRQAYIPGDKSVAPSNSTFSCGGRVLC